MKLEHEHRVAKCVEEIERPERELSLFEPRRIQIRKHHSEIVRLLNPKPRRRCFCQVKAARKELRRRLVDFRDEEIREKINLII